LEVIIVTLAPTVKLLNDVDIPVFGIGVDLVKDFEQGCQALLYALSIGYRSIDTAHSYGNEGMVGQAVKDCGIPRQEIYISTKLTQIDQGYDNSLRAFDRSLKNLGLDYIDSWLIHWPGKYYYVDTWKAFIRLYEQKLVRTIGVCNFNIHHLEDLRIQTGVIPAVEQVEWHPYFQQPELAEYCAKYRIQLEAWSPLMCGGEILKDPRIAAIAKAADKSPAQVILRWHIQQGRRIFPKSVTPARIKENLEIFDFELSPEQLASIDSMRGLENRIGPDPEIFFLQT
jgi:diketogulonate reductase-like aldo/keto reductase